MSPKTIERKLVHNVSKVSLLKSPSQLNNFATNGLKESTPLVDELISVEKDAML